MKHQLANCVVAFTGHRGAGKTTLSRQLATRLGCDRVSFGDRVREIAREEGANAEDVLILQEVGSIQVEKRPHEFCEEVLGQAGTDWKSRGLVIDGIRHRRILEILTGLVQPLPITLVYIDIPEEVRFQRLSARLGAPAATLTGHRNELEIESMRQYASVIIKADDGMTELLEALVRTRVLPLSG